MIASTPCGRRPARTVAALLGLLLLAVRPVSAEDNRVEVSPDQRTTVAGTFPSVAKLLEDLCSTAGVELQGFDAEDHDITLRLVRRPLLDVLPVLLARENYVLGLRSDPTSAGATRVAWIRVTGAKAGPERSLSLSAGPLTGPTPIPAAEAVIQRLLKKGNARRRFLETDNALLAESLKRYPGMTLALGRAREGQPRKVRRKIEDLIGRIDRALAAKKR